MRVSYSVTFEFETRAPRTHRGVVRAGSEHTCASRAIKAARMALRPVGWTSLVVVLLERLPEVAKVPKCEHLTSSSCPCTPKQGRPNKVAQPVTTAAPQPPA